MKEKIKEAILFYKKVKFAKVKNNENILIYGISRGGTTMLAEALVAVLNARLVWEPLFPHREVFLNSLNPYSTHHYNRLNLGWNPHIACTDVHEVNDYFESLFSLKERNIRFYRFTNLAEFSSQKQTIFKFCFGNFMYPYFNQKFGFKSIVLLRHPFAIAASSLNFGSNYDWHKENFSDWKYSESLYSEGAFEKLNEHTSLITSAFALLVYQVVAQSSYILNQINKENTIVVYYEDLVVNQELVFEELETFFGRKLEKNTFIAALSKQSFSSQDGHTSTDAIAQLSKWKQKCSVEDIEQGLRIFDVFDFGVYSDAILPLKN